MWSHFKENKFIVDKLIESRTCCGGCEENVIKASYRKISVLIFMEYIHGREIFCRYIHERKISVAAFVNEKLLSLHS